MNRFLLFGRLRSGLLLLACMAAGLNAAFAQTISVSPSGANYTFSIPDYLGEHDLVVYRFSDGYSKSIINSSSSLPGGGSSNFSPDASITRQFNTAGEHTVTAYIARKGGPLRFASESFSVDMTCASCPPVISGNPIQFRYTWAPFTDNSDIPAFTESTVPEMTTPSEPWFFLIATIAPNTSNSISTITIPEPFTADGAIYENRWGKHIDIAPAKSVDIDGAGHEVIIRAPASGPAFNVFILLRGMPSQGEAYQFTGNMSFPALPFKTFPPVVASVESRGNPHDPNILSSTVTSICATQFESQEVRYRVEFQNIGNARASGVGVQVHFEDPVSNQTVIDVSGMQVTAHGPADAALTTNVHQPGDIYFDFPDINLKGLYEYPPPSSVSGTIGWVEFSVNTNTCLQIGKLVTSATVNFTAQNFSEYINTNMVTPVHIDYNSQCKPDDRCTGELPRGRSVDAGEIVAPRVYPTLFGDQLNIDVPAAEPNVVVDTRLFDITGKQWLDTRIPAAGQHTLDTSALPGGMYLVHLLQGDQTRVYKVLKNNR